jgi:hypothetical protein
MRSFFRRSGFMHVSLTLYYFGKIVNDWSDSIHNFKTSNSLCRFTTVSNRPTFPAFTQARHWDKVTEVPPNDISPANNKTFQRRQLQNVSYSNLNRRERYWPFKGGSVEWQMIGIMPGDLQSLVSSHETAMQIKLTNGFASGNVSCSFRSQFAQTGSLLVNGIADPRVFSL